MNALRTKRVPAMRAFVNRKHGGMIQASGRTVRQFSRIRILLRTDIGDGDLDAVQAEFGSPETNSLPGVQGFLGNRSAIHERPVGGAEIAHGNGGIGHHDLAMETGDRDIGNTDLVGRIASHPVQAGLKLEGAWLQQTD